MPRILFDPAPTDGGSGAAPAHATAPPAAPAIDPVLRELAELRTFKAQADLAAKQRAEADRLAAQQQLAAKGQIEDVVRAHNEEIQKEREKVAALDRRARQSERTRALAQALAGHDLSYPEASEDLARLWSDDFEVADGPAGEFVPRCRTTLRTVADVVAERLASPRFARFVKAEAGGGGGHAGGGRAAPNPDPNAHATPQTFEQQVMADWAAQKVADQSLPSWQRDWRSNVVKSNVTR